MPLTGSRVSVEVRIRAHGILAQLGTRREQLLIAIDEARRW
jgi:hypothetical protein